MDIVEDAVYCETCVTNYEDEINELTERIAGLERELYEALKEIDGYEDKKWVKLETYLSNKASPSHL
jgi:SMC interacting uncharacterized protein involved in chromosome segregation